MTEIRQSRLFSNFNSTLHNLWVLKYKFEIVTIVQVDHILNFKEIALYLQYKLSFILFKKTLRQFGPFRQIGPIRQFGPLRQIHRSPYGRSRTDSDGFRTLEIVKKYVYVFTL